MNEAGRAWVGVVSRAHVLLGVRGGFAQLCHGKRAPLSKMSVGDWLVYYSPTTELGPSAASLRAFTAIGRVVGEEAYLFDLGNGFVPYRRDVAYRPLAREVPVREFAPSLEFIQSSSNWGMLARRGHFEISALDFARIADAASAFEESPSSPLPSNRPKLARGGTLAAASR